MEKGFDFELNDTWMNGKYSIGEINASLPFVSVEADRAGTETDWFFQGEEANKVISEIHKHWLLSGCNQEEAFQWYVNTYLY